MGHAAAKEHPSNSAQPHERLPTRVVAFESFLLLPPDLRARVLSNLAQVEDLNCARAAGRACRELLHRPDVWRGVLKVRWGPRAVRHEQSVAELQARYRALQDIRAEVRDMSIHWLNNPEYMRLEEPWGNAFSAQVLHLRYVWWLHIGGTLRDVPAGRYTVRWVMSAGPQGMLPGVTRFAASVLPNTRGSGVTFSCDFGAAVPPREWAVNNWKEFAIGEITLDAPGSVQVTMQNHDGNTLKRDLWWDCVRLKRVG